MARYEDRDLAKMASELQADQRDLVKPKKKAEELGIAGLDHLMLPVDPSHAEITDHICALPGVYAWWSARYKDAEDAAARLQDEHDVWYAQKYHEAIDALDGKPTEARIKHFITVENEKELAKRQKALRDAVRLRERLKYAVKAWDHKSVLLPALARLAASEFDRSQVTVKRRDRPMPPPIEEPIEEDVEEDVEEPKVEAPAPAPEVDEDEDNPLL